MMAHELIAKTPAGKKVSLGVFDTAGFAAFVRDAYRGELGDEYTSIAIEETDDETVVIEDPGEPAVNDG